MFNLKDVVGENHFVSTTDTNSNIGDDAIKMSSENDIFTWSEFLRKYSSFVLVILKSYPTNSQNVGWTIVCKIFVFQQG